MAARMSRIFLFFLVAGSMLFITMVGIYRKKLKPPNFKNLLAQFRYIDITPMNTTAMNATSFDYITTQSAQATRSNKVLILFWSKYFGSTVPCDQQVHDGKLCNNTNLKHCKVPCEITNNRDRAADANIMIIHARDPSPLPPSKYSHIPLTLFTWENPVYTPMLYNKEFVAKFSYLMSYRADVADFFLPSFDKPSVEPRPIPFADKTGLIAAVFSNCETARTRYLKELMKYIQVDSYGSCLRNKKDLQGRYTGNFKEAKTKLLRKYKFTIVFHNQDCAYFIDDQLTHALIAGSVPVYMGSDKVDELLGGNLHNSIIKVKDFATPKKLADYLMSVSKNETLYNEYLTWKYKGFQFPQSFLDKPQGRAWQYEIHPDYCEMCQTMADVADKKIEVKPKGSVKPDYCKPREVKDWLNV